MSGWDDDAVELEILRDDSSMIEQSWNRRWRRRRHSANCEGKDDQVSKPDVFRKCMWSVFSKVCGGRTYSNSKCSVGKVSHKDNERRIRANDPIYNAQYKYANNYIKTSKYSVLTFLPYNLFEQFQHLANFYFLCLMVLQMINVISSLTPITTAMPLIGVLTLTAIKAAYDDYQRHKNDSLVNNRTAKVVRKQGLVNEKWSRVNVGDVIRMDNNQFVAADVLLLSTSEPSGLSFIETAELDGESNLKCRQCLPETAAMGQDDYQIGRFNGEIICETPNNLLNKFEGTLIWKGNRYPLDNDKVVLRGCILRNTDWCYGVVIFAGKDTKLMQNSGKTKFKRTNIDRLLNYIIIGIVFFLISICLICTVACGFWEYIVGQYFQIYLPWPSIVPKEHLTGAAVIAGLAFFSYVIVLNTVVPISLYVSVEVIRFMQSFLINWDEQMYCYKRKMGAKARTTTLNEELGQIHYIFSDKTGTLTQNIMTFNKCSVAGQAYGEIIDPKTGYVMEINEHTQKLDFSSNKDYEPSFRFYDKTLLEAVMNKNEDVYLFFRVLALCHTVMPDERNGKLEYQAQSPDEAALVSAARNFGFVFKARTPNSITIEVMGVKEEYELLCILDFNNERKRMSVILKQGRNIRLYCKGADQVIYERLRKGDEVLKTKSQEHLNKFAGDGLRTLCFAVRNLDENFFAEWKTRHHEAATSMDQRTEKLDALYAEIETGMSLVGVSAIEDKLQDGVPQTIANLSLADIKIWVLTGDKQETAINIAYSSQLFNDDMDISIIDGHTYDEVATQLRRCRDTINDGLMSVAMQQSSFGQFSFSNAEMSQSPEEDKTTLHAIVINGHSLVHALDPQLEEYFLSVGTKSKAVICCRVTPLQKALVVELIKKSQNAVTLAIGDGANDVSMIKAAHVGVGISGQEGNQAMLASDYSLAQFRFLERLLLVHGRWSYYRMCKFLRYFFFKNFAFTLCHFWFSFFCGFSAQTVFDPMFISVYNLFYTSLPVLALGVFDQDVNEKNSILYPQLYTPGQKDLLFNKKQFLLSALHGFFASAVLFFIPYGTYMDGISVNGHLLSDHKFLGSVVDVLLVISVTAQVALDTSYWTVFNHITIWGSLASFFILGFVYNYFFGGSYVGSLSMAMYEPQFYFTLLLTVTILIVPVLTIRFYRVDVDPTLSHRVRLKQRLEVTRLRQSQATLRTPSARKARRSIRSGYAFAHQEGFGGLITSGKLMRKTVKNLVVEQLGGSQKNVNPMVDRVL